MNSAQLLNLITRGKTNRLSTEALLDFFRPLETWLMQQNRNEIVVGWNSNMEDVELFQSMNSAGNRAAASCFATIFIFTILLRF